MGITKVNKIGGTIHNERTILILTLLSIPIVLALSFDFTVHFHSTGGPYPKAEIATSNMLLRPLMRYFGDREERYGAKLLKEIKARFEDMTRVFMDIKNVS